MTKQLARRDLSRFTVHAGRGAELSGEAAAAYPARVSISAIVTAGDGPASKTIAGDNKGYLLLGGQALVARVVLTLQNVPEISDVWVVGNAERLEALFADPELRTQIDKPLHFVEQFRNLYENAWRTFRCLLPEAGPDGRDPKGAEVDRPVLYISADLPFATPQEVSEFVKRSTALGCDYALGLAPEESLKEFYASSADQPGIRVAYFNTREGRFRQSNLHYAKPARILNRHYIEEMYEHRYQQEFGHIARLAWTILRSEQGGLKTLFLYACIHLAGVANRHGFRGVANILRRFVSLPAIERAIGTLLRTDYRFVTTDAGGCAVDIDNEQEYEVADRRFEEWSAAQAKKAEQLYGPVALPPGESG